MFTRKSITPLVLAIIIGTSSLLSTVKVLAIPAGQQEFFSSNDIIFFDPDCKQVDTSSGGGDITAGTPTKTMEAFVDKYGQMAFDTGKKYGIPYEAILAQGIIESGYGSSKLTQQANNFFGIKAGTGWTGQVVTFQTAEQRPDGSVYYVDAAFRKYPTPQEGWDGYGNFITSNSRYKPALAHPGDPIAYITAIKAAGYATDVAYVSKVGGIALSIAAYIKKTGKWPPSSEVAKTNTPTGDTGAGTVSAEATGCGAAGGGDAGNGSLVKTALDLAWPNEGKHNGTGKNLARPSYQEAMPKFNDYSNAPYAPWTDCGVFVATVVRMSGVDPKYQGRSTGLQLSYARGNSQYETFPFNDTAILKPGDIIVNPVHTFMFTGPYQGMNDDGAKPTTPNGKTYNIAQGSLYDHPPDAGNVTASDAKKGYFLVRVKK